MAKERSWHYEGHSLTSGVPLSGTIVAATALIARVKLRKLAIIPQTLTLRRSTSSANTRRGNSLKWLARADEIHALVQQEQLRGQLKQQIRKPVSDKEITVFIKQLLVVIKSGIPLLAAFDIVIRGQENRKFRAILQAIKNGVTNGQSLSASFGAYPKVFEPLFINFLAIGEQGGILESLLQRFIEYKEKSAALRRKVTAALTYPAIVVVVSLLVLAVVLGFVVPQFEQIFNEMGAQLPPLTLLVVGLSALVVHYWWMLLLALMSASYAFRLCYRRFPRWRFINDSLRLMLPVVGKLAQKTLLARWTRTLALLFAAGVPLNEALRSIALLVDNYRYGAATLAIQAEVEAGTSLYLALLNRQIFPNLLTQMVAVGEEAGALELLLQSVAGYYDQEIEVVIESLLALLEPCTIVVLGVLLGAIIVAIYLPLFNLGNVVG